MNFSENSNINPFLHLSELFFGLSLKWDIQILDDVNLNQLNGGRNTFETIPQDVKTISSFAKKVYILREYV